MKKNFKKEEIISGILDFIKDASHEKILPQLADELKDVAYGKEKVKTAYIYSPIFLSDVQKDQIKRKLEELFGLEISLKEVVDKSLLGGFRIKVSDWVYDASLKGEIELLKNELYANI